VLDVSGQTVQYVVDFNPGLCGPFGDADEASDWAQRMVGEHGERGAIHSWSVVKLSSTDVVPNAILPPEQRSTRR
jgi:hypothetical protein